MIWKKERNGYKKIIEMSEETKYAPDGETKLLRKRVEELEIILSTYKKMLKESDEIKLGENSSFRFENVKLRKQSDELKNKLFFMLFFLF